MDRRAINALVLHSLICLLGLISVGLLREPSWSPNTRIMGACAVAVVVSLLCLRSWYVVSGSLFNPYGLFLLAAILFSNGQALLELFGTNERGILDTLFVTDTTVAAIQLATLGIAFFHAGGLLSVAVHGRRGIEPRRDDPTAERDRDALRIVGWLLLAVSIVPALLTLRDSLSVVETGGYQSLYQQDIGGLSAIPTILSNLIIPAMIFLLLGSGGRRFDLLVSVAVLALFSLTQMFLGLRTTMILPVLAYLWAFDHAIRRLSRPLLLIGGLVTMVVIFPTIAVVRNTPLEERGSLGDMLARYGDIENPIVAIVREMGTSLNTVAYTLELVPRFRPFDQGYGYLQALGNVAPIINWEQRPLPSTWLVQTVAPDTARRGGGLGYSFIAEAYLNFGWIGGLAVLTAIGFLVGSFFLRATRAPGLVGIALAACCLAFLPQYARGSAAIVVRAVVWYGVLPALLVVVLAGSIKPAPPVPAPRARARLPAR